MSTVKQIEAEILKLSAEEVSQLAQWLLELDEQNWDRQLEKDASSGKLDFLAAEALADYESGNYRTI